MAQAIQRQLFNSFLGLHEGINFTSLDGAFSSSGSKNVWMDEFGRVRKIQGFAKKNSTAVTTDTGGSATKISGIAQLRTFSGVTATRILVAVFDDGTDEWEIHTSSDDAATWTFKVDIGSGAVGRTPDFAQFGDTMFITTTVGTPRTLTGTTIGIAGGLQSPTPSLAATGAGDLNGTYRGKVVSVEADGSRHPGSVVSGSIQLTGENAAWTWTADTDTDVVGYELYRTTGTGLVFYFDQYVDGRLTVSATSTLSDLDLLANRTLEEHGDAPPSVHFCEPHKQRMWWGRTDTLPRRAFYSDPGDADSVWTSNNFLDFDDPESMGDVMTGMLGNHIDALVVFLERSVWTVSGTGALVGGVPDWVVRRSSALTGAVSNNSIVRIPRGARYFDETGKPVSTGAVSIAYFTPLLDVRLFDGENDTVISGPVTDLIAGINDAQRAKVFALHDSARSHITWYYPDGTATENTKGIRWNYKFGVWTEVSPISFSAGAEVENSTAQIVLLVGENITTTGGFIYEDWSGASFDGSNIEAIWITKPLFGFPLESQGDSSGGQVPDIAMPKRWREVDVVVAEATSAELSVEWIEGFAIDNAIASGSSTVLLTGGLLFTSGGSQIVTASGSGLAASVGSTQSRVLLKSTNGQYPVSDSLRLRFIDNSTSAAWALEAFTVHFQTVRPNENNIRFAN